MAQYSASKKAITKNQEDDILFQGDIILPKSFFLKNSGIDLHHHGHGSDYDDRIGTGINLWPKGKVRYKFERGHFNWQEKRKIWKAMKALQRKTCLRFIRVRSSRSRRENYVMISKRDSCSSSIGKVRKSRISIGKGCFRHGSIVHELMHTLGFWHEQSRPDRDKHVIFNENGVKKGKRYNFDIVYNHHPAVMDTPYDICSVMHYGEWDFHKNPNMHGARPTLKNKRNRICRSANGRRHKIGKAPTYTRSDLNRINKMYKCS